MVILLCHDAILLQCRCMEVTEKGYTAIAAGCQRLQVLRMYACAHVNDATLTACGQLLPDLRIIDICGAHLVTDSGAQVSSGCSVIYALCPYCTVLCTSVEYAVKRFVGWLRPLSSQLHCSRCPRNLFGNVHASCIPYL